MFYIFPLNHTTRRLKTYETHLECQTKSTRRVVSKNLRLICCGKRVENDSQLIHRALQDRHVHIRIVYGSPSSAIYAAESVKVNLSCVATVGYDVAQSATQSKVLMHT